jgi:hypothetical protein
MRQQCSSRFAMALDRRARQPANLLQIDRERSHVILDPRTSSGRVQRRCGLEIAFQQPHGGGETSVIESVRRSARTQSGPRQSGQAADVPFLQDPRQSTRSTRVLSHAVGRVPLLQEPRPESVEDWTENGQGCVATVNFRIELEQHRDLQRRVPTLARGPMLSIRNVESSRKSRWSAQCWRGLSLHYRVLTINREMCSSTFLDEEGRPSFNALQNYGSARSGDSIYASAALLPL